MLSTYTFFALCALVCITGIQGSDKGADKGGAKQESNKAV
jgi:hypothetical protein